MIFNMVGGGKTSRLPLAYQEVEYIQSDGNQYIVFPYSPNYGDAISIDLLFPSSPTGIPIYGTLNSSLAGVDLYIASDNSWRIHTPFSSGVLVCANTPSTNTRYFVTQNLSNASYISIIVDSSTIISGTGATYFSLDNFYLFARKAGSEFVCSEQRLYSFTALRNFVKYIELVPCYRKSDSVIGMYDIANDTFYTNAGTGTFTKGGDVT